MIATMCVPLSFSSFIAERNGERQYTLLHINRVVLAKIIKLVH